MEHYEREFFISRIDAGYIKYHCDDGKILHLQSPKKKDVYDANEIYVDTLKESSFMGVPFADDILAHLVREGIWTEQMQSDLDVLPDNIDKLKIELFNAAYKSNIRKKIRAYLTVSKEELVKLNDIRHSLDYMTCEGIASFAKWQHIVSASVTYEDNITPYDWEEESLAELMAFYQKCNFTEVQIRELARSEPWSSLWVVRKANGTIFPAPMTIDQQSLIIWSNMYDNIHESPDCPHETVLSDDDMLDGWLLIQRKKREKEQTQKRGQELTSNSKINNSQEIFVPAETQQDAKLIADMNEMYGNVVRKSRLNKVESEKEVKFGAFGDIKRRIQTESAAQFSNTIKKGK